MSLCCLCVSVAQFSSLEKKDSRAPACWGWVSRAFHGSHLWGDCIFTFIRASRGYHSVWFLPCSFLIFLPFLSGTPSFLVLHFPGHQDPQSLWRSSSSLRNPHPSSETLSELDVIASTQDLFLGLSSSLSSAQTALTASRVLRPLLAPSAYDPRASTLEH